MRASRREIIVASGALEYMVAGKPSDEELDALHNLLVDVGADPLLGYKIAFFTPLTYRIDAGRFRVHYRFDHDHIWVDFIGVY